MTFPTLGQRGAGRAAVLEWQVGSALIDPGITIEVDGLTPFMRGLSAAALKIRHPSSVELWRASA